MGAAQPVRLPEGKFTSEWVVHFAKTLVAASWKGQEALPQLLPAEIVVTILDKLFHVLAERPTVVQVDPDPETKVCVVGDTHGQLHDLVTLFRKAGLPSATSHFIFNGDFVDRGSWGLEVLLLLAAWQLALPQSVTLLRGNHESATCTAAYGFQGELVAKYKADAQRIYDAAENVFSSLPLAAHVAGATLVLHGGLFRAPAPAGGVRKRRKVTRGPLRVGTLEDLKGTAFKGGADPSGRGRTALPADVIWSDPVAEMGIRSNVVRGVGLVFGPDITEAFMEANNLKLIIRSHEGPDARYQVEDPEMNMSQGYSIDHTTRAGCLITVFSAPDYPQHMVAGEERYRNLAAVAVLRAPTFAEPEFLQFEADLPRPASVPFYSLDTPGSDEEIDIAGGASEVSAGSNDGPEVAGMEVSSGAIDKSGPPARRSVLDAPGRAHPQLRRSTRGRQPEADATAAGTDAGGASELAPASALPGGDAQRLPAASTGENENSADDYSEAAAPIANGAADPAIHAPGRHQHGVPAVLELGLAVVPQTESSAAPPNLGLPSVGDVGTSSGNGAGANGHTAPAVTSKEEKHLEAIFGAQHGAEALSANHAPAATPAQVTVVHVPSRANGHSSLESALAGQDKPAASSGKMAGILEAADHPPQDARVAQPPADAVQE